jgi:transcriptional regulator NrdR family protein
MKCQSTFESIPCGNEAIYVIQGKIRGRHVRRHASCIQCTELWKTSEHIDVFPLCVNSFETKEKNDPSSLPE